MALLPIIGSLEVRSISNEGREREAVDVEDQEDDWLMQQMLHREEEEGGLDWYGSCNLHDDNVWKGQLNESLKN